MDVEAAVQAVLKELGDDAKDLSEDHGKPPGSVVMIFDGFDLRHMIETAVSALLEPQEGPPILKIGIGANVGDTLATPLPDGSSLKVELRYPGVWEFQSKVIDGSRCCSVRLLERVEPYLIP